MRAVFLAAVLALTGCGPVSQWLAPHQEIAVICAHVTAQNAGVTCVNAAYELLNGEARVIQQRYLDGLTTADAREAARAQLDGYFATVEKAEYAVLLGDFTTAQGQLDGIIAVLTALERKSQ